MRVLIVHLLVLISLLGAESITASTKLEEAAERTSEGRIWQYVHCRAADCWDTGGGDGGGDGRALVELLVAGAGAGAGEEGLDDDDGTGGGGDWVDVDEDEELPD